MFAHHFGGDALRHLAEAAPVHRQAELGMGMHIDEARRHDLAGGVDHLFRFHGRAADIDDPVALDGNILLHPGTARAVHDVAVLDQDVGFARGRCLRVHPGRTGQ